MLYLIIAVLLIAWLLGFFVFSAGGLIHILLIVLVIVILYKLFRGRKTF